MDRFLPQLADVDKTFDSWAYTLAGMGVEIELTTEVEMVRPVTAERGKKLFLYFEVKLRFSAERGRDELEAEAIGQGQTPLAALENAIAAARHGRVSTQAFYRLY